MIRSSLLRPFQYISFRYVSRCRARFASCSTRSSFARSTLHRSRTAQTPILHDITHNVLTVTEPSSRLHRLVECFESEAPVLTGGAVPPDTIRHVGEEVMLGPLQPTKFRHEVEPFAVPELQVVEARNVVDVELALLHEIEERHQIAPARPRRVATHLWG
jgi:hypothetical protein